MPAHKRNAAPAPKPDLTVAEFAFVTKTSQVTVRANIRNGKIPSYKVGGSRRIRADVLEAIQRGEPVA